MTKENSHNFLKLALKESENYLSMEKMISALESKTDLQYLPLQPLYLAYTNLSLEKKVALLPELSQEQRQSESRVHDPGAAQAAGCRREGH